MLYLFCMVFSCSLPSWEWSWCIFILFICFPVSWSSLFKCFYYWIFSSCKKKKKILQKLGVWSLLWNPKSPTCSWPSHISFQSQFASLSSRLSPASQELTAARTRVVSFIHFSYKHGFHPLISNVDSMSLLVLTSLLPHSFLAGIWILQVVQW